jgi:predicted ATP-dependent endonuclease of OLD family
MLLKTLQLQNYKGFGSRQKIEFAEPGSTGSGLTIIVGPNNGGKSTILRAIRQLASGEEVFVLGADDRRNEPTRLQLTGSADDDFEIVVEGRGASARLAKSGSWKSGLDTDLHYVPSRRPWTDKFHTPPSQFNAKKLHETGLYHNSKQQEFYIDNQFGGSIAQIEINPEAKRGYTALLSRLEPTITDWTIDNREMDFISFTSVSGTAHRCGLVGEGVANIFRLAFALYDFKAGEVLLLDEPELSLHPQAQKRLYEELRQRAAIGQIVVSTHSPYFVSWKDIQSGAKIYRANLVPNDGTSLTTPQPQTIRQIAKVADEKKNRKLYDVVAKEIFFSLGCLFVEGQEDAHIISAYVDEKSIAGIEIFGYGSGGASLIGSWLSLALDLGIKAAAIFDGDEQGAAAFKRCSIKFSFKKDRVLLRMLPTPDIRNKPEMNKEGVFDEDWKLNEKYSKEWEHLMDEVATFLK